VVPIASFPAAFRALIDMTRTMPRPCLFFAVFAVIFLIIAVLFETGYRSNSQRDAVAHAHVVGKSVWDIYPDSAVRYLQLAADAYGYDSITIFADSDRKDAFAQATGKAPEGLLGLLASVGVLPCSHYEAPIYYRDELIGRLVIEQWHTSIMSLAYLALVLALLGVAVSIYSRVLVEKSLLEQRVIGRTSDLQDALAMVQNEASERIQAERTLRMTEERYRLYIDHAPDAVLVVNKQDQVVDANPAASHLLGYAREELLQLTLDDLTAEGRGQKAREVFHGSKLADAGSPAIEFIDKHGKGIPVALNAVALPNRQWLGFCADLTEHLELEQQLRQSEKMSALGQLAGGVAHDLNNQLQCILGYAQLLEKHGELQGFDRKSQGYMSNIQNACDRSSDLVKQLLAFSRQGERLHEPFNAHQVVLEVVEMLRLSGDKRMTVHASLFADTVDVQGDPTHFNSALLNIGVNARDAMAGAGEFSISTRNEVLARSLMVGEVELTPGTYLVVELADSGAGMSESVQARIFEPFFTTKETDKGTGLGLAAVYGTVRSMRGAIQVESKSNHGTTFTVYLPIVSKGLRSNFEAAQEYQHPPEQEHFILVVDDEPSLREMTSEVFVHAGCLTKMCADGGEAIDALTLIKKKGDAISGMVLDLNMPRVSGVQVLEYVAREWPSLPVIVVSGFAEMNDLPAVAAREHWRLLHKPVSLTALMDLAEEHFFIRVST
jgi:PAS domain S-box-containing protein